MVSQESNLKNITQKINFLDQELKKLNLQDEDLIPIHLIQELDQIREDLIQTQLASHGTVNLSKMSFKEKEIFIASIEPGTIIQWQLGNCLLPIESMVVNNYQKKLLLIHSKNKITQTLSNDIHYSFIPPELRIESSRMEIAFSLFKRDLLAKQFNFAQLQASDPIIFIYQKLEKCFDGVGLNV